MGATLKAEPFRMLHLSLGNKWYRKFRRGFVLSVSDGTYFVAAPIFFEQKDYGKQHIVNL
jgi:hypothetical protein